MRYEERVRQLEAEGMTTSDAQAVADAEDLSRVITIHYRACDGFAKTATFTDLHDARNYAQTWVGSRPEVGGGYAVSDDGLSTITVEGCSLADLLEGML